MLSDVYFPRVNGVSTSIRTFARSLLRMGHRVTLVAPDYGDGAAVPDDSGLEVIRLPSRVIFFDPEDRLIRSRAMRQAVDRLFAFDTVEQIFAALYAEGSGWASAQLAILKTKSPQSLKVTLRQLRAGAALTSFADNMAMEYALGGRVVRTHDFQEGVRAVIVDKDNAPKWSPADQSGVTEATLDALFAPLPDNEKWTPLP